MTLDKWIALGIIVAGLLTIWILQVVQKNCTIRDQEKIIETFADLSPELRKEFGERIWMDSVEGDGKIQYSRVLDYLTARDSVKASRVATNLVEQVESRFDK